jgi:hypothetical protein
MNKELFMQIVFDAREYGNYLMWKKELHQIMRVLIGTECNVALRFIAYGSPCDTIDEYLCMAELTCF